MIKHVEKWEESLDVIERKVLLLQTTDRFEEVNNHLRGLEENVALEEDIKHIDKAISKFKLPKDIKVFRTQTEDRFKINKFKIEDVVESFKYVTEIPFKNYISTSLKESCALDHIEYLKENYDADFYLLLKATLNKGTFCAYLGNISCFSKECELLLMRNKIFKINEAKIKKLTHCNEKIIVLIGEFIELEE